LGFLLRRRFHATVKDDDILRELGQPISEIQEMIFALREGDRRSYCLQCQQHVVEDQVPGVRTSSRDVASLTNWVEGWGDSVCGFEKLVPPDQYFDQGVRTFSFRARQHHLNSRHLARESHLPGRFAAEAVATTPRKI
jgi:hypothetical protein